MKKKWDEKTYKKGQKMLYNFLIKKSSKIYYIFLVKKYCFIKYLNFL